ncbi:MAG: DNA helicase RecG, partial [Armatimonadota bacterium]|nr:DNA helicase RecG [Armatimonadota bacterium]
MAGDRATGGEPLRTPVRFVKDVGPQTALLLGKLGIHTARDLLLHFPHRYEDRTQIRPIAQLRHGERVTVLGCLAGSESVRTRNGKFLFKAYLEDESGVLELVFFNQWHLQRVFGRLRGRWLAVYGPVEVSPWGRVMKSPDWEELDDADDPARSACIVPVYPLTEGLSQKTVRRAIGNALASFLDYVPEPLPAALRARHRLMPIRDALRNIHQPEEASKLDLARRRLVFEEFFLLQLALARRKHTQQEAKPGISFPLDPDFDRRFRQSL